MFKRGAAEWLPGMKKNLGTLSDEMLMRRYAAGNADAFEVLYHRHKDPIYAYMMKHCGRADEAIELTHDMWIGVIGARHRYRPTAKFPTYLFCLARNRLIDHYRRRAHDPLTRADAEGLTDPDGLPVEGRADPERRAHAERVLERLTREIDGLPEAQRDAVLHHVAGYTHAETARASDVPVETIRSRVRYALAKLRRTLAERTS